MNHLLKEAFAKLLGLSAGTLVYVYLHWTGGMDWWFACVIAFLTASLLWFIFSPGDEDG